MISMHIGAWIFPCPLCGPGESSWHFGHLDEILWLPGLLESDFCTCPLREWSRILLIIVLDTHGIWFLVLLIA